jgi:hypothetical protein
MSDYGVSTEYAPLLAGQAAANAVAERETAHADRYLNDRAAIPVQRRIAEQPLEEGDDDFEPDTCFYCGTTANVVVHPYISGVYGVCDDDLEEHQRTFPEAAALAAE